MNKSGKPLRSFGAIGLAAAVIAIIGAVSAVSSSANAACCVAYDYADAIQGRASVESTIDTHFDTSIAQLQIDIVNALRSHASQMTLNNNQLIRSNASIQNGVDARQVNRKAEDAMQYALRETASGSSVCNVITNVIASQNQAGTMARYREEVQQQSLDYYAGASASTASSSGARAALEQRVTQHCAIAAVQADINDGTCPASTPLSKAAGAAPAGASSAATPDGTPLPTTVGNDQSATVFLGATYGVMDADQQAQASLFLLNAITPTPMAALPKGTGNTENGRRIIANRIASTARISVATSAVSQIITDRATNGANSETQTDALRSWAEGTAKQIPGYTQHASKATGASSAVSFFPDGVSHTAMMDLRAKSWFFNPNFDSDLDHHNAAQISKDLAVMTAWMINQNNELYKLTENVSLTLATMLSIMIETNRGQVN